MTVESIRLECYREAAAAERTRPGIRKPLREIANGFAAFCGDSELRLTALKMAIADSNPRADLDAVIAMAHAFVDFAQEKPKLPPLQQSPVPKAEPPLKRRRSSRSR